MYHRYVMDKSTQTISISMDDICNEWRRHHGQAVQISYGGPPPPITPYIIRPPRQQASTYPENPPPRWRRDNMLGEPTRCVTIPPAMHHLRQPQPSTFFNDPTLHNPTITMDLRPGRGRPRQRLDPTQCRMRMPRSTTFSVPSTGPRQPVHGHLTDTFSQPPPYTARHHGTPRSQAPCMGRRSIPGRHAASPAFDAILASTDDEDLTADAFTEFLYELAQLQRDADATANYRQTPERTVQHPLTAAESFRRNPQPRRPMYKYAMRTYGQPPQENHLVTTTDPNTNQLTTIGPISIHQTRDNPNPSHISFDGQPITANHSRTSHTHRPSPRNPPANQSAPNDQSHELSNDPGLAQQPVSSDQILTEENTNDNTPSQQQSARSCDLRHRINALTLPVTDSDNNDSDIGEQQ